MPRFYAASVAIGTRSAPVLVAKRHDRPVAQTAAAIGLTLASWDRHPAGMPKFALVLLAVPTLVAAASLLPGLSQPVVQPVAARAETAPLAIAQYAVNLGKVPPQPAVAARYEFTNASDRPVEIVGLEPSCGCLRPSLEGDATLAPGESAAVAVKMLTAGESPGWHDQTVTLRSRDADGRTHKQTLAFRVHLPEQKVLLQPKEMYFYQLRGQAGEQMLRVSDDRDAPITVTRVGIANSPAEGAAPIAGWVDVELIDSQAGSAEVAVRVREGLPAGRRTGWVVVETDDADQPRLVVPVLLEGQFDRSALRR